MWRSAKTWWLAISIPAVVGWVVSVTWGLVTAGAFVLCLVGSVVGAGYCERSPMCRRFRQWRKHLWSG